MTSFAKNYFPQTDVYGIDPSGKSIEDAIQQFKTIEFKILHNNQMPYASSSMDFVFSAGVFHHIPFEAP